MGEQERTSNMKNRARFVRALARGAVAFGLALTLRGLAAAQDVPGYAHDPVRDEPEPKVLPRPSRFDLPGLGDFAISALKATGSNRWFVTNSGPGDTFGFFSALPGGVRGTAWGGSSYMSQFFEIQLWATAPASEWKKHRDLVPSLNKIKNAEGLNPGYNVRNNLQRWAPDLHWAYQGKDGSLGLLHSGVTTTNDGTCRDHSKPQFSSIQTGIPLLPGSDCPETWGSLGWQGSRPIPRASWEKLAKELGDNFTFDFWKVPPERHNRDKFLGDFQTYGVTVDYGLEAREKFGEVMPGGSGKPLLEGYPMGLEFRFDAYVFQLEAVANIYWYQVLVINNSAEVYGVGLDYDSLYVGTLVRPLHVRQNPTAYVDIARAAVISDVVGRFPRCNNAKVIGDIRPCVTSAPRGHQAGVSGVIVMKSPIGDLRNKLFTRGDPQTNPFYNPDHPLRGDTITFNQNNLCGFTCTQAQHIQGSGTSYQAARSFGTLAHKEALALNDRVSSDLTERQYFDLFHNEDWPTRWSPATGYAGGFNRYIPGVHDNKPVWRYTNRPKGATAPGPDTLYLGACGSKGCVTVWADTLPGGFPMNLHNTAWVGAGPFPLAAGDTTSFIFAYWSSPDSITAELHINKAIEFYLDFFLGPEAPPPPRIVAQNVTGGSRGAGDTRISLYFDESLLRWVDPFLDDVAAKMERAVFPDPLARIRALNPWLPDSIRTRARNNVEAIYVYKSCNAGATWTASSRCQRDEARDFERTPSGPGWQAYAKLDPTTRVFTDTRMTAGQTYLYSVLARSRGVKFLIADSVDANGDGRFDRLGGVEYVLAPPIMNTLTASTGAPNVASVYVPASVTAGGQLARPVFKKLTGYLSSSILPVTFGIVGRVKAPVPYRLLYADSVVVTEWRDNASGKVDSTRVRAFQRADTASTGTTRRLATYGTPGSFLSTDPEGVPVSGGVSVTGPDVTGTKTVKTTTLAIGKGQSLTKVVLDAGSGAPLYVVGGTTSLTTPVDVLARKGSPPILITTDLTLGGTLASELWLSTKGDTLRSLAFPTLTWVSAGSARSRATGVIYGEYEITWQDREFGDPGEITLNFLDQPGTRGAFAAMLQARRKVQKTVVDAATAALLGVDAGDLAEVWLPFTVKNVTTGASVTVAMLKADKLSNQLLGTVPDTLRVPIPADVWVPGERLIFIEAFDRPLTRQVGARTVYTIENNQLKRTSAPAVTWDGVFLGCTTPRGDPDRTCNPVRGTGATGYTRVFPGQKQIVRYYPPFTSEVAIDVEVQPDVVGTEVKQVTENDLQKVRVVPNPYVFFSTYQQAANTRRLLFTGLPPEGRIRIYTATGQFVQELTWEPGQLGATGDLYWNLRSREDTEVASGLYVYVVTATGQAGGNRQAIGKFVIIR